MPDRRDFQPAACHQVQDSGPPDKKPFVTDAEPPGVLTLTVDRDVRP